MSMLEITPGLYRWTAPHPEWKPGAEPGSPADWDQLVGSVLYETPGQRSSCSTRCCRRMTATASWPADDA